jgi:hypothetical protein
MYAIIFSPIKHQRIGNNCIISFLAADASVPFLDQVRDIRGWIF